MSKITVLMPVYNGIDFLQRAICSVREQVGCEWSLVVSDDGSTDGSFDYLNSIRDDRVRVFRNNGQSGIFGNLNFLLSKVETEYIYILCQDDFLLHSRSLSEVLSLWNCDAAGCAFIRFNHGADIKSKLGFLQARRLHGVILPEISDLIFFIFGCVPGNLSNISLKKNIVDAGDVFRQDLPYAGDFEYWSRIGRKYSWYISDKEVAKIWNHPRQASFSLNRRGELVAQIVLVVNGLFDNLQASGYESFFLRLMGTLHYSNQHRDLGIKKLLESKRFEYIKVAENQLSQGRFCFGTFASWIVYILSLGGRLWRVQVANYLLNKHIA